MLSLRSISFLLLSCAFADTSVSHVHDESFTPDEVLHVTRADISIGGIQRYSTVINGSIPGPPLRFKEDSVVWVRVHNDMTDDNLTMHWHGISQAAYPFSDGTPLASQWPIPPQHFFDYELSFPKDSAGTYFFHSHIGFQANTAAGALIVEENGSKPYPVDDERTILIQELFNKTDAQALDGLEASPMKWTGDNSGWLINGKTIANYSVVNNASAQWSIIDVEPCKTYRFRFIGGNTLAFAVLGFENHTDLQVIEADAGYTKPTSTDVIQIGAGQRFSTLFKTKSCDELTKLGRNEFYMMVQSRDRPNINTGYAILRYNTTCGLRKTTQLPTNRYPSRAPIALPPINTDWLEYALKPLSPNGFPSASEVTRRVYLNATQYIHGDGAYQWIDDNVAWTEEASDPLQHVTPAEPYLVALYNNQTRYLPDYNASLRNGGLDPKTSTFPARIGEVIEIVIQQFGAIAPNGGGTPGGLDTHPWHGHGVHYYDLGSGKGGYDPAANEKRLNGMSPVRRDTTMLYRYVPSVTPGEVAGWRAWRLRITDPGVWMVHCHILQHMIQGMQTVWVHGDAKDILTVPKPMVQGYLTYGGDVYGNETHAPKVVHFSEVEQQRRR